MGGGEKREVLCILGCRQESGRGQKKRRGKMVCESHIYHQVENKVGEYGS